MNRRTVVVPVLALALAVLTPLARFSPPDPTWFGGFWDNADYDDVILLICAIAADLPMPVAPPSATREVVRIIPLSEPSKPPVIAVASCLSRAPPRV